MFKSEAVEFNVNYNYANITCFWAQSAKFSCLRKSVFFNSNFRSVASGLSQKMSAETSDDEQSAAKVIEEVLKNELDCLVDAHRSVPSIRKYPASPLQHHQVGRDGGRRKVYVVADITPQDLNMNNAVELTEHVRKWIRNDGYPCDEPGLIVPAEFGASAEIFNIIPWSNLVWFIIVLFY